MVLNVTVLSKPPTILRVELSEELILVSKGEIPEPPGLSVVSALTWIDRLSLRVDSLHWCLSNLHSLRHECCREFAVGLIDSFVAKNWNEIPAEWYGLLVSELFANLFCDRDFQAPPFLHKIYKVQAVVASRLYPRVWPDFFRVLVTAQSAHLFGFLSEFNLSLYDRSDDDLREFENATLVDGSQELVLTTIITDVVNGNSEACEALASTVEWMDFNLLLSEHYLERFFQMLEHEHSLVHGLRILTHIFRKSMASEVRLELVESSDLAGRLELVLHKTKDADVCECMANLVLASARPIVYHEVSLKFVTVAMNLYSLPLLNVTSTIKVFLDALLESFPKIAGTLLDRLLNKIQDTIALRSESTDQILTFSLSLLLQACSKVDESVVDQFVSLLQRIDQVENVVGIATLLSSLKAVLELNDKTELRIRIATLCVPILRIPPPYGPPHFIAVTNYGLLVEPCFHSLDHGLIAELFCQSVRLVMGNETTTENSFERASLIEMVNMLCTNHPQLLLQIPGVEKAILSFIHSGGAELLSSASSMLRYVEPNARMQMYHHSLQVFAERLKTSPRSPSFVIAFLSPINLRGCEKFAPELLSFVEHLQGPCLNDTALYSSFVEAATSALGPSVFPVLWNQKELLILPENAVFVVEAAESLIGLPSQDARFGQVCELILATIETHLQREEEQLWHVNSDEEVVTRRFCEAVVKFLVPVLRKLPTQMVQGALNFAFFHCSNYDLVLTCLDAYSQVPPSAIVDSFAKFYSKLIQTVRVFSWTEKLEQLESIIRKLFGLLRKLYPLIRSCELASPEWESVPFLEATGPQIVSDILTCADAGLDDRISSFIRLVSDTCPRYNPDDEEELY